jgi:predicted enzyme related to lactoylglutathione lyase
MDPDTSIGGHHDRFPETRRSALIDIQSDVASLREGAREAFIAAYWMITTGDGQPGINGGMMRRSHPGAGTVNTVDVASVDEAVKQIQGHGGKVVAPKMPIPGVGYLAYCQDPEGNTFGIMQADPAAK